MDWDKRLWWQDINCVRECAFWCILLDIGLKNSVFDTSCDWLCMRHAAMYVEFDSLMKLAAKTYDTILIYPYVRTE